VEAGVAEAAETAVAVALEAKAAAAAVDTCQTRCTAPAGSWEVVTEVVVGRVGRVAVTVVVETAAAAAGTAAMAAASAAVDTGTAQARPRE
jgi:hypothetical protein